jgi:hypothetical protein
MKNATRDQEETSHSVETRSSDAELREAAERIYERYGSDLGAFYRDVRRELMKREDSSQEE